MKNQTNVDAVDDDPAWVRAQERGRSLREIYGHLFIYCAVSVLLVAIDVAGGSEGTTFLGLDWAFWPIGGWGIGVLFHTLRVFGPLTNWEDRKATQLYERERERRSQPR